MKKITTHSVRICIYGTVLFSALTSCYSSVVMQTAATVEKGKHQTSISGGFTRDSFPVGYAPMIGLSHRYGVGRSDEVQFFAAYTAIFHGRLEWKHLIFSSVDSLFMISTGFGFEGIYEPVDLQSNHTFFPGASIPMYMSLFNTKRIAFYGHTRFSLQFLNATVLLDPERYSLEDFPESGKTSLLRNKSYWTNSIGARLNCSKDINVYIELGLSTFISSEVGGDYFEKKENSGNFSTVTYDYKFVRRRQLFPMVQFNMGLSFRLN